MNIIELITQKYHGEYSEEIAKGVNSPGGKSFYQPKNGIIEIEGSKISINLKEVGGAMLETEPFRITLYLDAIYKPSLTVFPKGFWYTIVGIFNNKTRFILPKIIRKQFWFEGNIELIKILGSDTVFAESILDERIYIRMENKKTSRIILTPERGIKNLEQFEKYVGVLKRIEANMKALR